MKTFPTISTAVAFALLLLSPLNAELHTFTNSSGDTLKAKLLSHKDGKVTLEREDGKTFEIEPKIFSTADQRFINEWMIQTPEKIIYDFKIKGSEKKLPTTRKHRHWVYTISATNDSQDTAKDLVFEYRVAYKLSDKQNYLRLHDGTEALTQSLEFNKTFIITTTKISLRKTLHTDAEIIGCLLRIRDSNGNIVHNWASSEPAMKTITWESQDKGDHNPVPGTGVIK